MSACKIKIEGISTITPKSILYQYTAMIMVNDNHVVDNKNVLKQHKARNMHVTENIK